MSEMDEPSVPEIKDHNAIDMVKLNTYISPENVANTHGVGVVRSPIVANHTIEVRA